MYSTLRDKAKTETIPKRGQIGCLIESISSEKERLLRFPESFLLGMLCYQAFSLPPFWNGLLSHVIFPFYNPSRSAICSWYLFVPRSSCLS